MYDCHLQGAPLSPREKQLLRRIAAGKTDAQIAERFGGGVKRVAEQRARLLNKLGAREPLKRPSGWRAGAPIVA
ncbi:MULTISPECIES: helix-turn-helix domain-containing protein [Bradyrhizobium]|uniref:helix-turn-helix domain-containing protein n=1 Tax=Bradyrhizobium TaxID=374 RepID=UPI00155E4D2E|nr:hypothetical protein [Bradyrhizobium sp. WBAH30]MDD1544231.1 hypothetical protein [Bradyrhizobium sp. WBAH41]MDD1558113.1 hypothetical protein [Bradyrhizobium sp. WBAH23]MDD1565511.1 hypothetical protein [Bradyrhizobium sp. WBAH33]MDD1590641.1 hypothetical protein [Bradyrhizobium sp. WBAH42]NRB89189.1 hypothetical protein [Bradyrhizobium sp. WBAH10]QCJ89630.1 hypothetical protein DAA57_14825 [Bradyrhizobium yuanmingense]